MSIKKVSEIDEETFRKYLDLFLNDTKRRQIEIPTIAALRSELDTLKVAAKKLLNEMPESEIELIREVWGNTNTRILLERRSELEAALAGKE